MEMIVRGLGWQPFFFVLLLLASDQCSAQCGDCNNLDVHQISDQVAMTTVGGAVTLSCIRSRNITNSGWYIFTKEIDFVKVHPGTSFRDERLAHLDHGEQEGLDAIGMGTIFNITISNWRITDDYTFVTCEVESIGACFKERPIKPFIIEVRYPVSTTEESTTLAEADITATNATTTATNATTTATNATTTATTNTTNATTTATNAPTNATNAMTATTEDMATPTNDTGISEPDAQKRLSTSGTGDNLLYAILTGVIAIMLLQLLQITCWCTPQRFRRNWLRKVSTPPRQTVDHVFQNGRGLLDDSLTGTLSIPSH